MVRPESRRGADVRMRHGSRTKCSSTNPAARRATTAATTTSTTAAVVRAAAALAAAVAVCPPATAAAGAAAAGGVALAAGGCPWMLAAELKGGVNGGNVNAACPGMMPRSAAHGVQRLRGGGEHGQAVRATSSRYCSTWGSISFYSNRKRQRTKPAVLLLILLV